MEKKRWNRFEIRKRSNTLKRRARKIETSTTKHAHKFLVSRWENIIVVKINIVVWMVAVGVLIAAVGMQTIWFRNSYITKANVSGGTYAEAIIGPLTNLNPLFSKTRAELAVSHLIFSSLLVYDSTGSLHNDLAKSVTDNGGNVYKVNMRTDARWHDGQSLTADDVVFTVGLMKNDDVGAVQASSWRNIKAVALDKYTVEFTLPNVYAAFPAALTFPILPKHILKDVEPNAIKESSFSSAPIGSGPFVFHLLQSLNQDGSRKVVSLDASNDYYRGRARINHIQISVYPTNTDIVKALKSDEVTAASGMDSEIVHSLNASRHTVDFSPVNDGIYAMFNLSRDSLKDIKVRQALRLAVNLNELSDEIYGHPTPQYLPFVGSQVDGSSSIPAPEFDVDKANALLDKDGWKMTDGIRSKHGVALKLQIVTRSNTEYGKAIQVLARQWRKIGVQVDGRIYDSTKAGQDFAADILSTHDFDVLLDDLSIGGDPDVYAYWYSTGLLNFTGYNSKLSDELLLSARSVTNKSLRSAKYVNFAKQWLKDIPAIGLYRPNLIYVHKQSVNSLSDGDVSVSPDDHFANILDWTVRSGTVYKTP